MVAVCGAFIVQRYKELSLFHALLCVYRLRFGRLENDDVRMDFARRPLAKSCVEYYKSACRPTQRSVWIAQLVHCFFEAQKPLVDLIIHFLSTWTSCELKPR